ncbi:MAG TPA: MFS transporter [Candidatus Paceibacterota bacterium]
MPEEITLPKKRAIMYAIAFVFSLSSALPAYINSSFLSELFINSSLVGIIYTASSLLAIAAFIEMPALVRRFGNFRVTISLLLLELLSLAGLIMGSDTLAVISAFILNFVSISLINFTLDVFLESFSSNTATGKIRGTFLTIANMAWLISPMLGAYILGDNAFHRIYIASAALIVPVIALVLINLRGIREPEYNHMPFWKSFGEIWTDRNIKGVLLIQFLLQFFFAWMIIYTPIYLHETVGFDWKTMGVIFTVMLLPFVLLDVPLGRLADKAGEKAMMSIGFVIMAISTALIAFVTDHNVLIWTIVLFMTRVGAAMVEIMTDTYFFKKVDASKTHIISFFRTARPLAYVVGPIIATILFTVFDMKGLFVFLSLLMLYGLRYSLAIEDVKPRA